VGASLPHPPPQHPPTFDSDMLPMPSMGKGAPTMEVEFRCEEMARYGFEFVFSGYTGHD
jgi:hypothetical protein